MEQLIKEKQEKIYWLALITLFLGAISLIWSEFTLIAIILGVITLKRLKKPATGINRDMAMLGIILGLINVVLVLIRLYPVLTSGSQEIRVTRENIEKRLLYTDFYCNTGVVLTGGIYKSSDYLCGQETFKNVLFKIYEDKIAIGDLNNDGRDDVAVIIAKDYGDGRQPMYELSVSINQTVIGSSEKMLVSKARRLLEGDSAIKDIKIENGVVSLGLTKCCPEEEKNINYIFTEGNQFLQEI